MTVNDFAPRNYHGVTNNGLPGDSELVAAALKASRPKVEPRDGSLEGMNEHHDWRRQVQFQLKAFQAQYKTLSKPKFLDAAGWNDRRTYHPGA